jgi:chromosome segregation protein
MHLRSITLKGFKSFPDRTKLDFSPGVSVIVGPNGSGKSNITDAVLWALGVVAWLLVRVARRCVRVVGPPPHHPPSVPVAGAPICEKHPAPRHRIRRHRT